MSEDEKSKDKRTISEETVEQMKSNILRGVGYRSPPQETQFKKGKSGNPKGRPKREVSTSTYRLFLAEAERMVPIREGGEAGEVMAIVAMQRAEFASGIRGNALSQRNYSLRYEKAIEFREREKRSNIEIAERYIESARKELAEATAKGTPSPTLLPHPEDVIIDADSERGYRIIGPASKEELKLTMDVVSHRDQLLLQNALDYKQADDQRAEYFLGPFGPAYWIATIVNFALPPRLRLTEAQLEWRVLRSALIPKRKLLREVYQGWLALGMPEKRGAMFPMFKPEQVLEAQNKVLSQQITGE